MDLIKKTILVVVTLILIAVLGCLIVGVAIMRTNSTPSASNLPPAPSLFSASDTITLWMAVLSLMVTLSSLIVTGAGIIIGVLAVVGFQTFKTAVQQGASEAARDSAEEYRGRRLTMNWCLASIWGLGLSEPHREGNRLTYSGSLTRSGSTQNDNLNRILRG